MPDSIQSDRLRELEDLAPGGPLRCRRPSCCCRHPGGDHGQPAERDAMGEGLLAGFNSAEQVLHGIATELEAQP